jgi:hypothetical protein
MRLSPNLLSEETRVSQTLSVADNTATVVTIAADTGQEWVVDKAIFSYDASPTGGLLTVAIGGNNICILDIIAGGQVVIDFRAGRENIGITGVLATSGQYSGTARNQAVVVTLAAGGSGIGSELTVIYR